MLKNVGTFHDVSLVYSIRFLSLSLFRDATEISTHARLFLKDNNK